MAIIIISQLFWPNFYDETFRESSFYGYVSTWDPSYESFSPFLSIFGPWLKRASFLPVGTFFISMQIKGLRQQTILDNDEEKFLKIIEKS